MKIIHSVEAIDRLLPVYVYGAGRGGRLVRRALRRRQLRDIAAFIDSNRSFRLDGRAVLSLDDFAARPPEARQLVIASTYAKAIAAALEARGIDDAVDARPLVQHLIDEEAWRSNLIRTFLVCAGWLGLAWLLL